MIGLRSKMSLGFGGLLVIIGLIGGQSIVYLTRLGASVDVILRENYRSVIACQRMKEALERIDSGILFILLGYGRVGADLIQKNQTAFDQALQTELDNLTVPGEKEAAFETRDLYTRYLDTLNGIIQSGAERGRRTETYFTGLLPLFGRIKDGADEILRMNQQNMLDANDRARRDAASARRQMIVLLLAGTAVAAGFIALAGRWILGPIRQLTQSAEEIRRGNLDLVVRGKSRDEIGTLSDTFNAMAAGLREFRRSDQAKLLRVRRATQRAFDSLPEAVAVVDLEGAVEVATEAARTIFGLKPGIRVRDLAEPWLRSLFDEASWGARPGTSLQTPSPLIQRFVANDERYFRPEAVPILNDDRQPIGVTLVLQDVTQLRQQDEIKRGVISTVSHQLKTPLTSVRMAIHLLLEERVGPLTEKQAELLIAAREDSDRLHGILDNLLDLSRIESGRARLALEAVAVGTLAEEALEPFRRAAQDQGLTLDVEIPAGLPEVWADQSRIRHVFGNLLSNALRFTPPGGRITVAAEAEADRVRLSISDTGRGIPAPYLGQVFEPFFRVPDQGAETGAGLGLAIVKDIVEAHGGSVGVESREGQGSKFFFSLRRVDRFPREGVAP
jgi:NtrC-family two-component system sensor histidine kinase KinB